MSEAKHVDFRVVDTEGKVKSQIIASVETTTWFEQMEYFFKSMEMAGYTVPKSVQEALTTKAKMMMIDYVIKTTGASA